MSKLQDERTKLLATFVNGIGIATVAAGAIAPLVAVTYGVSNAVTSPLIAFFGLAWLVAGCALHLVARWLLKGLSP
jgi:VIT1/CCC1 family predicted Fe2+/Mn2+ transporter